MLIIRLGVAVTMVLFGINQLLSPAQWISYIPGSLRNILPIKPETTMRMHALGNIILGLWLAVGIYPIAGSWVNLLWWISILPFAFIKDWRIGMRDLSIIASLVALILLQNIP